MIRDDLSANEKALARRAKVKSPARKGETVIENRFCKGCGLCINKCPTGVLLFHNTPTNKWGVEVVADGPEYCIGCRLCEMHCPDFAIFAYALDESGNRVTG